MALEREVKIVRTFNAPLSLVWAAWTQPARIAQWWGPRGFTNPVCKWDARPGGRIHVVMRASEEIAKMIGRADHPMTGEFTEVKPTERLAFVSTAKDDAGKPLLEALTTVRFAERDGKTEMVLHASAKGFVDIAARMLEGMDAGWMQSIDKLEEHVGVGRARIHDQPHVQCTAQQGVEGVFRPQRAVQMVRPGRL